MIKNWIKEKALIKEQYKKDLELCLRNRICPDCGGTLRIEYGQDNLHHYKCSECTYDGMA